MFLKLSSSCIGLLLAGIILSGCATPNQTGRMEPLARTGIGYVLTSLVSRNESSDPELKLAGTAVVSAAFFSPNSPKSPEFFSRGGGMLVNPESSVPEQGGFRTMALMPVKPGKYKMGHVGGEFVFYKKYIIIDTIDPPMIEVREGEVVYAGSIKLVTFVGKGLFGQALPASFNITVGDEYESDYALIKSLDQRVRDFKVVNGLPHLSR